MPVFVSAQAVPIGLLPFGGQALLPSVPCPCSLPTGAPGLWTMICNQSGIPLPTPLFIATPPITDVNLVGLVNPGTFFIPGVEYIGKYNPIPTICGIIGVGGACIPNPIIGAIPAFGIVSTVGNGGLPSGPPVCLPPGVDVAAATAAATAGAGVGAAGSALLTPGEEFNTATTDPGANFPEPPSDFNNYTNLTTPPTDPNTYPLYDPLVYSDPDTTYLNNLINNNSLRIGITGRTDQVRQLQNFLLANNVGPASLALERALIRDPSAVGQYGRLTQAAVDEFRRVRPQYPGFYAGCYGDSCGLSSNNTLLRVPYGGVVNVANTGVSLTRASSRLEVTHFGGSSDVRKTPEGYALTKRGDVTSDMRLGEFYEQQFGGQVKWYYALDSNGQKIQLPDGTGTSGGGISYNEAGSPFRGNAVAGLPMRQIDSNSFYMAYPLNNNISGLPSLPARGIDLTGASGLIRLKDGTYINLPFIDRGPLKGNKIDVSPGAYKYIQDHGGIDAITTVRRDDNGNLVNVSRGDLLSR